MRSETYRLADLAMGVIKCISGGPSQQEKAIDFFEKNPPPDAPGPINSVRCCHNLRQYVEIALIRFDENDVKNLRYIAANIHNKS